MSSRTYWQLYEIVTLRCFRKSRRSSKFQQLELEARTYVELAKSFPPENIYVAQNVLNGVRYYDPESILQNFKETAEGLHKAFKVVLDQHGKIEWDISSIRSQATAAGQRARVLASQANTKTL